MNDEQKKEEQNTQENLDWKDKFSDLVQTCQTELKKTTKIGMKMISATQSNSQLHECYEEIGKWLVEEYNSGNIQVDNERIEGLISRVSDLNSQLSDYEKEVQEIKKG